MSKKRGQGEIFGIALLFVIIVLGIIIYTQIKLVSPQTQENLQTEKEYKILAQSTLNTMLTVSTGCVVERDDESLKDLINYCIAMSSSSSSDPELVCKEGTVSSCTHAKAVSKASLDTLFTGENAIIGNIPYELTFTMPDYLTHSLGNLTISNFDEISVKGITLTKDNYRKLGYKKTPSYPAAWATADSDMRVQLYLYYK
ncbi:MAG: hypothetical protein H6500_00840 [Candidatus Woesearchaeota archaeon]|nr:hypothetical protein [Nanoarchaeota archaeon]USN44379.1 MAG: hypothetical protein H6500_00840 [Candidatus Woesearchaeota archaeon]